MESQVGVAAAPSGGKAHGGPCYDSCSPGKVELLAGSHADAHRLVPPGGVKLQLEPTHLAL